MRRGTGGKGKGRGRGKGKGEAGGSQQSPPPSPQHSSQPSQPHPQHSSQPQPSPQNNMRDIEQARMQRTVVGTDATRDIVADNVQWAAIIEAVIDGKLSVAEDVRREEEECRKIIAEAEKRLIDTKNEAYEEFMQEVAAARQRMVGKVNIVQHEVTGVIATAQQCLATLNTDANTNAALALGREMSNDFQDTINNMRTLLQQRMEPHTSILNQQRAAQEN